MYSIPIDTVAVPRADGVRLNLGVGGNGVVGRTVSILDGRSGKVVGEGIIGWSWREDR